jgi:riboflavin biosynthesis pyrimidine reductase
MTKWEYLRVYIGESLGGRYAEKANKIIANGVEVVQNGKDKMNIYDYLNQLGQEGWELIFRESGLYSDGTIFYLKRPLE